MKILKPQIPNQHSPYWHPGDSFRELLDMWGENKFCEVIPTNTNLIWVEREGGILLYDRDQLNQLPPAFEFGLFSTTVPTFPKSSPWILWGRSPRMLEEFRKKEFKKYADRNIESLFLGKVENPVQLKNRTTVDWATNIELIEMPVSQGYPIAAYKYTQEEYLDLLRNAKFGLSIPGYGPKCSREIEYFGLGVVPIVTPNLDITYYEPLIKNTHYLYVESPEEIPNAINNVSASQWEEMSQAGREWFDRNCSLNGSFNTTMRIINKNNLL